MELKMNIHRKKQSIRQNRRVISLVLVISMLFSLGIHFPDTVLKSRAASPYWDNTTVNPLTFGALPKTFATSPQNVVTLKQFVIDNGTGVGFTLLDKYKSGGNFDKTKCLIMLEDAADLLSWSQKCYFKNVGAANPMLERSVYLSANYILGNNIDYGSTVGMIPIGLLGNNDANSRFIGTFDGQGFEITNLTLTKNNTTYFFDELGNPAQYYSMFSHVGDGGVVKNLGVLAPKYEDPYGLNLSLKTAGIVGYNRGLVQYCFVVSGTNRYSATYQPAEISGVVHTNEGTLDGTYYAGGITNAVNHTGTKYNPVVFLNLSGTIEDTYYDSTLFDATINTDYAQVVSKTTALLQDKTGILTDDEWYIDNYNRQVTNYVVGYPRLQGFKYNNAVNNGTTNPFYIARPADLIFFSNSLNLYPLFANSNTRFYRLRSCIDMTTVSAYAYTTPTNDFYANFEGTIDNGSETCVANHVGTGEQLDGHCIINLQITKPSYKLISTTQHILMGLVFNSTTNNVYFKNINIVGGKVTLPALLETEAYNSFCSMGTLVSYTAGYATLNNVHNSADVIALGDGDYICKLRMGGLVGCASYNVNSYKCSNNGTIDGGTHKYTSTANNTSMVGGLIGSQDTSGGTRRLLECVNYGSVTGVSFTSNTSTGVINTCYVGGIGGYVVSTSFTLDRVINYGTINSVKKLALDATVLPINNYISGGLFGYGPIGPSSGAPTDTRMCNKGTIYVNKTDSTTAGGATAAGISGSTVASANAYKLVGNAGSIIIAKDIKSTYIAGITNGAVSLYNCYNDGVFSTEDDSALSPTAEVRFFGLSGGSSTNTSYVLTNCYNNIDLNINILNATATVRVAGIAFNMTLATCENIGNIDVNINTLTGASYISGVADSSAVATSTINSGAITVNVLDQSSALYVAGVVGGFNQNGNVTSCKNNANIYVERYNRASTTANKNTYIGGVRVGNSTTNATDAIIDSENNGEISYDGYYADDAIAGSKSVTTNVFIGGIVVYARSVNRCVNNGDIILAKLKDFTGTNAYIAGIVYSSFYSNNANIVSNCRNFGEIYNIFNVGTTTNATLRNIIYSGIVYYGPPNMSRCVNLGAITLTSSNSTMSTMNMFVNGVAHYTGNIDANRVDYGVTGLANVAELKIDHSANILPGNSRMTISGIISILGTGNTLYVGALPFKNLVNSGKITALVKTDSAITYSTPTNNGYVAASANVTVAGVSSMAGYNSINASTESIPLRDCANATDINVDLICGSSTPSSAITYNVGGIVANSASNSAGFNNQRLDIYDCVNGGNITVNAATALTSNGASGVGGILGYGYQYTNGVTTATESNVHSSIYNCMNYGNIKGGFSTGGIVGTDGAVIKNTMNYGSVIGVNNSSIGGIVGAVRGVNKSYNTRHLLAIDGSINYGTVVAESGHTPQYIGGIIGNLAIGQDATYGIRRYENIINASAVKFVGNMVVQNATTVFGTGTLVDLSTVAGVEPAWETSDTFFKSKLTYLIDGLVTDSGSIYFKDTNIDSNSFFWRVGEDLPENNNWFVYITPDQSTRNTYSGGQYTPYTNGIYALSTNAGKKGGFYPSSNVLLQNCDPILLSGSGYTNWRVDIVGTNTASVVDIMRNFRQIKLNTGNDILELELTSGGGTPTLLRYGEIDPVTSKVKFYVVKDNFTPSNYTPDMYSVNTVLSDKALFEGGVIIDLSSGIDFSQAGLQSFVFTVIAEDGNTKDWTIEIHTVVEGSALTLTQIKEGINLVNSSGAFSTHAFTSSNAYNYSLTGEVVSTHNNTLILNFNTVGLLPNKNMITDVSLLNSVGGTVSTGVSSSGLTASNSTYYKVVPAGSYGVDSYNYKIISSDYITYNGTLSVNVRLHSNLASGDYKIAINTIYGIYYFNFTRSLCTEAEVQSNPSVLLVSGGNASCTLDSANAQVNGGLIYYGNAPDVSKVPQVNGNGVFVSKPTISKNATMGPQRLISVTTNVDGSRVYLFGFYITSQSGVVKDWKIRCATQIPDTTPAAIEVDFSGTTYFGAQVTDPDIMNEIFAMNKNQSGSYLVKYDVTRGSTSANQLYSILNNNYYTFELYRNNVLVPSSDYASLGFTIAKQTIVGNFLKIGIDATAAIPSGAYELRTCYNRPLVELSPTVYDDANNAYSQMTWTKNVQYPSFYFFKAIGKKLSFATGLSVPYVPDTYTFTSGATSLYWDGSNIDYSALGTDINTEENARYSNHRVFNIGYKYKTDVFYYNFKPIFSLPDGASLYRETLPGQWELITEDNLAADFSEGKIIRYRVYAEDTRFYNDYNIQLLTVIKSKTFNITFNFQNGASNTLPVSATLKSVGEISQDNYMVYGNTTVFSYPTTTYAVDILPPGIYAFDVQVPYGYEASIVADNSPLVNDIIIGGRRIAGDWKMLTAMNDVLQNFSITVNIQPISGFSVPWGLRIENRGN